MRMETAGCVVLSFSAAPRKLRRFATQRKVSIVRKSIIVPVLPGVMWTDKKNLSKVIRNDDWTGSDRNDALKSANGGTCDARRLCGDSPTKGAARYRSRCPSCRALRCARCADRRPRARLRAGQPRDPAARLCGG